MAAWIVREEIEHIDLTAYGKAAAALRESLAGPIGSYYRTDCPIYGDADCPVKYFLWVKVLDCEACGRPFDLFPGYLVAEDSRHPKNVLVCPACGDLNEVADRRQPGPCHGCGAILRGSGPAGRNRCNCPHCGHTNTYPRPTAGPLRHRLFAIEYYNPKRKSGHAGRFFKRPDAKDLERAEAAASHFARIVPEFIPADRIPPGDETDRLHRWGYRYYRELFNPRQLLALSSPPGKLPRCLRLAFVMRWLPIFPICSATKICCAGTTLGRSNRSTCSPYMVFPSGWSSVSRTCWASETEPAREWVLGDGSISLTSTPRPKAIAMRRLK